MLGFCAVLRIEGSTSLSGLCSELRSSSLDSAKCDKHLKTQTLKCELVGKAVLVGSGDRVHSRSNGTDELSGKVNN